MLYLYKCNVLNVPYNVYMYIFVRLYNGSEFVLLWYYSECSHNRTDSVL